MGNEKLDQVVAAAHKARHTREQDYREQALKLYPWICGRCGRDFTRINLRELTVHHRNHNHDYNPTDGSNWELLCLYCHDNEHQRQLESAHPAMPKQRVAEATDTPFSQLRELLQNTDRSQKKR